MHRVRTLLAVVLAAATLVALPSGAAAATDVGYLRLAHLSPDTPQVDVYVTAAGDPRESFVVPGVAYGTVSAYRAVPAGSYVVSMRSAGAPADSPPVLSLTAIVGRAHAYTVAGLGRYSDLGLRLLDDDLALPPAGEARVRVVAAAATSATVDVAVAGGDRIATGLAFGTGSDYRTVPAGAWTLRVGVPGSPDVDVPAPLDANRVYTLLLLDRDGRLVGRLHEDAVGSSTVPSGGVETGLGGPSGRTPWVVAIAAASLALLSTALVASLRRAPRRGRLG